MTLEEAVQGSPIHTALNGSGTHAVLVMQFHGGGHVVRIQDISGRWLPEGIHYIAATRLDGSAWQPLDKLPEDYGWGDW